MKDEYVKVREASLKFITLRGNRMADWVEKNGCTDCNASGFSLMYG